VSPTTTAPASPVEALDVAELRRRLEALLGIPATEGNALVVLRNGDEIFPAMLEAVEAAQQSVDFCTFVYWRGDVAHRFAHALGGRARAGVRVRVLIDAFGGRQIEPMLTEHMQRCGVDVRWFRPLRAAALLRPHKQNYRGHRKVLVRLRRAGRVHGRCRYRRGVVWERAQPGRVAGHALPRRRPCR
jgi:cardiolipin synthase